MPVEAEVWDATMEAATAAVPGQAARGVARVSHLGARVPAGFGAKQPRAVGRAAWDSESTGTRDRGGVARVSHLGARVPAGFGAKQPRAVGRAAWDSESTGTRDRGGVARVSHLGARVPAGFGAKQPRAVGRAAWDSESTRVIAAVGPWTGATNTGAIGA